MKSKKMYVVVTWDTESPRLTSATTKKTLEEAKADVCSWYEDSSNDENYEYGTIDDDQMFACAVINNGRTENCQAIEIDC